MSTYRNAMLLIADDWSPIAGCYGSPVIQTPNVDALAARGTRFTHAFCTTPSCAASRASLLTGHYSHTILRCGRRLPSITGRFPGWTRGSAWR